MSGSVVKNYLLAAAFTVPTEKIEGWTQLKFKNIPANEVSSDSSSLIIQVKKSASPLVYKLENTREISGFSFTLFHEGDRPEIKPGEFSEDFIMRFGLVGVGTKTLSRLQRLIAADWVKKLFDLSPSGVGLDKIYFYNVGIASEQLAQKRIHPKSDLMQEEVVFIYNKSEQKFNMDLKQPIRTAAIWLSVDGDDTKSNYTIRASQMKLYER